MTTALDLIDDFGERVGADGELLDEFGTVLICFPPKLATDSDVIMLASAITRHRCAGTGAIRQALAAWRSEGLPQ